MRLLHVLSQLPDRTGSGIYLQTLVREAARRGHSQAVVAAANADQQVQQPVQHSLVRFSTAELPFLLPGMSDVMPYPSTRWADLDGQQLGAYMEHFEAALRAARQKHRPQLVHVNHLWLVASVARRVFSDLPLVASCHGTDLRQAVLCPALARQLIPACRGLDRVLALTPLQARQIEQQYGIDAARIQVMGAGINTELFRPPGGDRDQLLDTIRGAHDELPLPAGTPRVIYVGKLAAAKGLESLLDAAQLLAQRGEDFSLLLVGSGSGPETERIQARARKMAPTVQLLGHLPQELVAQLLRACQVFVLPSFYEGLPMVTAEALASGCRVVISDLPVIHGWPDAQLLLHQELVRVALPPMQSVDRPHDHGLAPFAGRLAEAISGQLARARAEPVPPGAARTRQVFDWSRLFGRIERIYDQLLPRP